MASRIYSLLVAGILIAAYSHVGPVSAQSPSETRANSQCLVPTPVIFVGNPFAVQIDVKPGNPRNRLNEDSGGVVDIAICSDDPDGTGPLPPTFFAPGQVVVICSRPPAAFPSAQSCQDRNVPLEPIPPGLLPSTPTAGRTGFEFSLHSCNVERDINGDNVDDLVCKFYVDRMMLTQFDMVVHLRGCCKTPEFDGANAINCETDCPPSFPPIDIE